MGWLSAGDSYEVSLVDGKVAARSTKGRATGRPLKTLPKALRDHPEVDRLRQLVEWLDRHTADCANRVNAWMVSSLPVPTALLTRIWPDPAWRNALYDLVVVGDGPDETGFLRDATTTGVLRVVNLDGETVRLSPTTVCLPHPVRLPDVADLREFATELGITQRIDQLHRATFDKPSDVKAQEAKVAEATSGSLASRSAVTARANALGYQVAGSRVTCRIFEAGRLVEATISIDWDYWSSETTIDSLYWRIPDDRGLKLPEVGPVAWSEGLRMAGALAGGPAIELGRNA